MGVPKHPESCEVTLSPVPHKSVPLALAGRNQPQVDEGFGLRVVR